MKSGTTNTDAGFYRCQEEFVVKYKGQNVVAAAVSTHLLRAGILPAYLISMDSVCAESLGVLRHILLITYANNETEQKSSTNNWRFLSQNDKSSRSSSCSPKC